MCVTPTLNLMCRVWQQLIREAVAVGGAGEGLGGGQAKQKFKKGSKVISHPSPHAA